MAEQMKMSMAEMLTMVQGWQQASLKMRKQFLQVQAEMKQSMQLAADIAYGGEEKGIGGATHARLQAAADTAQWLAQEMKVQESLIRQIVSDYAEKTKQAASVGGDMMQD